MTAIEKIESELSVKLITSCTDISDAELKKLQLFNNLKFIEIISITEFVDICKDIIDNGFGKYKFAKVGNNYAVVITKSCLILTTSSKSASGVREFANENIMKFYSTLIGGGI